MNDLFSFGRADWEHLIDALRPGSSVSALRMLNALEAESEEGVDDALEALAQKRVALDISMLPQDFGSGEQEKRLRFEAKLSESADMISLLEDTDPLRLYLEELAATPAQGDVNILCQRLLQGDETVQPLLMNLYLHRVVDIAKEHTGKGVLLLDLMQEGGLGLWQAILKYKGGDFDAHADWWIRQSIACVILRQARESGVLRSMQSSMEAYRQADKRLLTELGRNATIEELAVELGITPEQVDVIRDMILNASAMEKAKAPVKEQEPEDEQAVEDTAYFQSRQRVDEMLSDVSELEAKILSLRFGLDGKPPMTAEKVGQTLGLTADEVVAAEAAALQKLRNS